MRNFKWEEMSPPELASYLNIIENHRESMRGEGGGGGGGALSCLESFVWIILNIIFVLFIMAFFSFSLFEHTSFYKKYGRPAYKPTVYSIPVEPQPMITNGYGYSYADTPSNRNNKMLKYFNADRNFDSERFRQDISEEYKRREAEEKYQLWLMQTYNISPRDVVELRNSGTLDIYRRYLYPGNGHSNNENYPTRRYIHNGRYYECGDAY